MNLRVLQQVIQVQESVMQGEGISTPHIHCTQWDPYRLVFSKRGLRVKRLVVRGKTGLFN